MSKKDSPSAPPAPDPMATAQAQSQINQKSAITQAELDRINQYTPQGSMTYAQTGTNPDGTPQYSQTVSYSPDEQQKYDLNNQVAISLDQLANKGVSQVQDAMSQPFSYSGETPLQTSLDTTYRMHGIGQTADKVQGKLDYSGLSALPQAGDFSADAQKASDNAYAQATSRLNPQWTNNDNDLKAQLAAQGISENSDAYRRAQTQEAQAKTDAYNQANYSAQQMGNAQQQALYQEALSSRQQGQNEVNTQGQFANDAQAQEFAQKAARAQVDNSNATTVFNEGEQAAQFNNQARQQQTQEQAYARELPINEISTLLNGGQVNNPQFSNYAQVGVAAPNYMGMVQSNYNTAMNQYNLQQQAQAQMLGSIFGAAGTVGAAAVSDMRFKENIKRIGELANGLATYSFNYIGDAAKRFGVMAQEALKVVPEAVGRLSNGVLYVDYRKVW